MSENLHWTQFPWHVTTVTFNNAQILALRATPQEIVPAPGAGKKLLFWRAAIRVDGTAGAFTESTANLAFKHVNGSGVQLSETVECTGFIDQAGKMHTNARAKLDAICTDAQTANQNIVLHNLGAGEFGGGNVANSMTVTCYYIVVDLP